MEEKEEYRVVPYEDKGEEQTAWGGSILPVVPPVEGYKANWKERPKSTPRNLIRRRPDGVLYVGWQDYADGLDAIFGPGNWWAETKQVMVKPYVTQIRGMDREVEEVIWVGWLVVPALAGIRREALGSMVRKEGMTYADALNGARSNAIRRAAIEAIGLYRDVAGDASTIPTADQMEAAVKAFAALVKKIGLEESRKVVESAGFGEVLDAVGNLHPDKLDRTDIEPLLQAIAVALTKGTDA